MIVLDTHVLIWWLNDPARVSDAAHRLISRAVAKGDVRVSTISVLEIVTACRRGRLVFSVPVDRWLSDVYRLPELHFEPVTAEVASLAGAFGDDLHGDPADRIIVATALLLGCPLVTADDRLRASSTVRAEW